MEHHHRRDSGSDTCLSSSDEAELLRRAGAPERLRRLEAFVRQPSASPEEGEERYSGAVVEDRNEGSGARARRDAAQAREREDIERLLAEWDGDFALHEIRCAYQEASRDVERARALLQEWADRSDADRSDESDADVDLFEQEVRGSTTTKKKKKQKKAPHVVALIRPDLQSVDGSSPQKYTHKSSVTTQAKDCGALEIDTDGTVLLQAVVQALGIRDMSRETGLHSCATDPEGNARSKVLTRAVRLSSATARVNTFTGVKAADDVSKGSRAVVLVFKHSSDELARRLAAARQPRPEQPRTAAPRAAREPRAPPRPRARAIAPAPTRPRAPLLVPPPPPPPQDGDDDSDLDDVAAASKTKRGQRPAERMTSLNNQGNKNATMASLRSVLNPLLLKIYGGILDAIDIFTVTDRIYGKGACPSGFEGLDADGFLAFESGHWLVDRAAAEEYFRDGDYDWSWTAGGKLTASSGRSPCRIKPHVLTHA